MNLLIYNLIFLLFVRVTCKDIIWNTCPSNQQSYFIQQCSNFTFPLNRNNISMGIVNGFIRRGYLNKPTNNTLWFIAGGPGYSTRTLLQMADFFISSDSSLTVYLLDARGTGLSSPLDCITPPVGAFNPYNESQVNSYYECNQDIINRYNEKLKYYTAYDTACDLRDSINLINPDTVSILGISYGTYATNTYMLLEGSRYDCIILDGPVPPNSWSLENNAVWNTHVTQDLLNLCITNSIICSTQLGIIGHIPRLVTDQIIDKTLPCLPKIPWLNTKSGQHWIANYNNFMTASRDAQPLLGPFFYRLYRCSDSDVEQLIHFDKVKQKTAYYPQDPLDYSLGYAINIGVSELYSFSTTPLNYSQQVTQTSRQMSDGSPQLIVSYAWDISKYPKYQVNSSTYRTFAKPNVPVLILVGTLDPNTENGLGYYFQKGLGSKSILLNIPYGTHGSINYNTPCINSIVLSFIQSLGTNYNTSCLVHSPDIYPPDFDGVLEITKNLSYHYFGTYSLWNTEIIFPPTLSPTISSNTKKSSSNENTCNYNSMNINKLTVIILSILLFLIFGLLLIIYYLILRLKKNAPQFDEKVLL